MSRDLEEIRCFAIEEANRNAQILGGGWDLVEMAQRIETFILRSETEEYQDELTLLKVNETIQRVISRRVDLTTGQLATDIITEMQNAGILFRERKPE